MVAATEVPNVLMIAGGLTPIIMVMLHREFMKKVMHFIRKIKKRRSEDPIQERSVSKGPKKSPVVVTTTTDEAIAVLKDEV